MEITLGVGKIKAYILLPMCMATMILLMLFRRGYYNLSAIKSVCITAFVAPLGFFGTKLMYYIENAGWSGQSFFGAVLFFPLLLFPVAYCFKIPLKILLDYSTPPGMAMLVLFKFNCFLEGCCGGKVLWFSEEGNPVFFPSQLVEMAVAFLITVSLLFLEKKHTGEGIVYPCCLITYGVTRFILNYYRFELSDFFLGMPAGNVWSFIALVIGLSWLVFYKKRKKKK